MTRKGQFVSPQREPQNQKISALARSPQLKHWQAFSVNLVVSSLALLYHTACLSRNLQGVRNSIAPQAVQTQRGMSQCYISLELVQGDVQEAAFGLQNAQCLTLYRYCDLYQAIQHQRWRQWKCSVLNYYRGRCNNLQTTRQNGRKWSRRSSTWISWLANHLCFTRFQLSSECKPRQPFFQNSKRACWLLLVTLHTDCKASHSFLCLCALQLAASRI